MTCEWPWRQKLKDIKYLALGRFRIIDLTSAFQSGQKAAGDEQAGQLLQRTKGLVDVYVQSNTLAPDRSTGWRMHPGQSLVIGTAGTVTDYVGLDLECRPHVYTKEMGLLIPVVNTYTTFGTKAMSNTRIIVVQFTPAEAARRIDVRDPGNCHPPPVTR